MSMILDALTRAEHERQLEKQPNLKFVNLVKPRNRKPKKTWVWVACGLFINALILFLIVRSLSDEATEGTQAAHSGRAAVTGDSAMMSSKAAGPSSAPAAVQQPASPALVQDELELHDPQPALDTQPLMMEANRSQALEVDRSLIYESGQSAPQRAPVRQGSVLFSATELSADDAISIANAPRLLIDQGEEMATQLLMQATDNILRLRDLPEHSRNKLQQYEVNVHVFDDDPVRRFVLINMNKYREGDRIANNGPMIEQITADGVVIEHANDRVLLPPK